MRRAYNLRVPSDSHRSGQLYFDGGHAGPTGGGLGLATFLLGDVQRFALRQPEHGRARAAVAPFYYLQDTWRATPKLTLNYGLRADIINPQTVNEPGNGGWLDINTGEIRVGGVGDIELDGNVENKINWAPRLGAAYQLNDKTVIRAGYGRSYDIGVFGSTFGHSVTQNLPVLAVQELNPPNTFDERVHPGPGSAARRCSPPCRRAAASRFRNGVFARLLNDEQNLLTWDAYNVISGQRAASRPSLRGQPRRGVHGRQPRHQLHPATIPGLGTLSQNDRGLLQRPRPTADGAAAPFGWTQGIDFFSNTRQEPLQLLPGEAHPALDRRLFAADPLHLPEGARTTTPILLPGSPT